MALDIFLLLVGMVLLVKGADLFVGGSSRNCQGNARSVACYRSYARVHGHKRARSVGKRERAAVAVCVEADTRDGAFRHVVQALKQIEKRIRAVRLVQVLRKHDYYVVVELRAGLYVFDKRLHGVGDESRVIRRADRIGTAVVTHGNDYRFGVLFLDGIAAIIFLISAPTRYSPPLMPFCKSAASTDD